MTLIYILIFLIFLEFLLRNYFEFFKDNDNSNNIKRIPNLSLNAPTSLGFLKPCIIIFFEAIFLTRSMSSVSPPTR